MNLTLVAASRTGGIYVSLDADGQYRRHNRFSAQDPVRITAEEAEWAISTYDYVRLGLPFSSWPSLAAHAETLVARSSFEPDRVKITAALAESLLPTLRAESREQGKADSTYRAIGRMLRSSHVQEHPDLVNRLLEVQDIAVRTLEGPRPYAIRSNGQDKSRLHQQQAYFQRAAA